ncbi:hypothetical protein F5883DRAFT_638737 [Diaporthe sp. PMI_573]|nr:hypothetical protein F5883DRAFT_638737 [Diaporthaceae sp. PMI_573]
MPPRKSRSATAKGTAESGSKSSEKTTAARKRKAADDNKDETGGVKPAKRSRTTKDSAQDSNALRQTEISMKPTNELEKPIITNPRPGSSISSITAISKGRSIGTIAPPHQSKDDATGKQGKEKGDGLPTVRVMGFPMTIKDNSVMVKGKPKTTREVSVVRKYGSDNVYGRVKDAMTEALQDWKGKEDDLDAKAFHIYEQFRPDVAKEQKGWGRKGELHLSKVRDSVRN